MKTKAQDLIGKVFGKLTVPNWCKKLGINYSTMRNRLNRSKMPFEKAVAFVKE